MSETLEQRVAALERKVAALHDQPRKSDKQKWLDDWYGKFAGDPIFAHAMELGAEYRRSLRPGRGKRKTV